jgi:hypothetical protein
MIKISIGLNAAALTELIRQEGEVEIEALKVKSTLQAIDFYLALGWLSRDCKIGFYTKSGALFIVMI